MILFRVDLMVVMLLIRNHNWKREVKRVVENREAFTATA
jgi:hypothetical protein